MQSMDSLKRLNVSRGHCSDLPLEALQMPRAGWEIVLLKCL
jgi:hypothetical protein